MFAYTDTRFSAKPDLADPCLWLVWCGSALFEVAAARGAPGLRVLARPPYAPTELTMFGVTRALSAAV